jgi:hypothetical protein
MYIGVPAISPDCVRLASSAARARPKSLIFDAVLQQDVRRLDVPVNQPLCVGGGQSVGDLLADPQHFGHIQRTVLIEPLLQRHPGDVFHHQVRDRLFLDGVDADDVLVFHRCRRAGLTQEPLPRRRRGGQLRVHQLDGYHPVQLVVERPDDDAERTAAEDFVHLVMPQPAQRSRGRRCLQQHAQVGQRIVGGGIVLIVRGLHQHHRRQRRGRHLFQGRGFQEVPRRGVRLQERFDLRPQPGVTSAGVVQERLALGRIGNFQGGQEDRLFGHDRNPREPRTAGVSLR